MQNYVCVLWHDYVQYLPFFGFFSQGICNLRQPTWLPDSVKHTIVREERLIPNLKRSFPIKSPPLPPNGGRPPTRLSWGPKGLSWSQMLQSFPRGPGLKTATVMKIHLVSTVRMSQKMIVKKVHQSQLQCRAVRWPLLRLLQGVLQAQQQQYQVSNQYVHLLMCLCALAISFIIVLLWNFILFDLA